MSTVVVTGCSSGIGLAVCQALLEQKETNVLGLSRRCPEGLHHHHRFTWLALDLADEAALLSQAARLEKWDDEIEAVVLAAGYGRFGALEQFSWAQMQRLMTVNFTSQAYLLNVLLPGMKRRGRGRVIFIGSDAALKGTRYGTIYCASKFAIRGFCQAMREECAKAEIPVSLINPGMVDTAFYEQQNFTPGEARVNHLLATDVAEYVLRIMADEPVFSVDEVTLTPMKKVVSGKKDDRP